jgi:phosphatidylethanolamine/phosphatidyl-N-methylethanolamine N-methyltransferase
VTPEPAPAVGADPAWREFLGAWVRNPGRIGAVAPSSPALSARLAAVAPSQGSPVVVELGPGTGAVTSAVSRRLPETARHLAVELDPAMAGYLGRVHPGVEIVTGDAADLMSLLAERDLKRVDAVISGLPWSLFGSETQQSILDQVVSVIGDTGVFATFAYSFGMPLPSARRFRATLNDTFDEVILTRTVWRNLPPAFCYLCRRPRGTARTAD